MKKFFIISIVAFALTQHIFAGFSVNPLIINFEIGAGRVSNSIEAYHLNDNNRPAPVEISVMIREVDIEGNIVYKPLQDETGDFVIYPERMILYPQERQRIQIQWTGNPKTVKAERVYAIMATEVEIEDRNLQEATTPTAQVVMNTQYAVLAVLKPANPRPETVVDSLYLTKDAKGNDAMAVILSNNGTGMQSLKNINLNFFEEKNNDRRYSYSVSGDNDRTKNSLFPGFKREIIFKWPEHIPQKKLKATASFGN